MGASPSSFAPASNSARLALIVAACAAAAACGPSLTEVRKYMAGSPHRRLAVFPLDTPTVPPPPPPPPGAPARVPEGFSLAALFQNKLRAEGFQVADRRKTEEVYGVSMLARGAFADPADAAVLARGLGAQAALLGRVESEDERVEVTPPVWVDDPARPGRRRRLAAERRTRLARISIRLRLVDAASARVLWETSYGAELVGGLPNVRDAVSSVLVEQLSDVYLKQGL